jgi:hypothetical protein
MIRACDRCSVVREVNLKYYPKCVSHGPCLRCLPIFLRKSGMEEKEIEEYMEKYKGEEN